MSINENEMSIITPNKKKILNNIKLIFPKKFTLNNNKSRSRRKIFPLKRFEPKNKLFLKIKLDNPTEISNKKYINNEKNNNINSMKARNNSHERYYNKNYEIKINSPLSPKNNYIKFSGELINNFKSLNNSHNYKHKIILPKIKIKNNENGLISKYAYNFKGPTKGISLDNLIKNKSLNNNIPINKDNLKINNNYAKSEKNLFIQNIQKENNIENIEDVNLEKLIFNKNYDELYDNSENFIKEKNPTEKLKEIHLNKLRNCNKLIKKIEKETKEKKDILDKYVKLMCQNIDNGLELNAYLA